MKNYRKLISLIIITVLSAAWLLGCSQTGKSANESEPAQSSSPAATEEDSSADIKLSVGTFATEDLDGNSVTEDIFSEKDYTMINVWGTFCGPCINEMPALEELNQSLPDNMQIIGVICDLPVSAKNGKTLKLAREIVETTGVTYTSLLIWDDASWFNNTSNVVPTTYFVDSQGNVVYDIIYGADIRAYKSAIEELSK